jgi:MFS family permease
MPEYGTLKASSSSLASDPDPLLDDGGPGSAGLAEERPSGFAATFRSLRHRNYRLYFFGQLVSLTGTWMQTTAVAWLAYKLTGESKWPALVAAAQIVPTFFFGAWGGALADRWPKRTLIFWTQSAFLLLALLLAVLTYGNAITAWQLLVVAALGGLVQAVDLPARLAFVMDMAGREDLMNAVALNSLLFNVARALGPALGGLLLVFFEPWACFFANGLSYLAVLWALALMNVDGAAVVVGRERGIRALLGGFAFLAGHRELAFLVLLATTTALCGWPVMALLPALAHHELGSQERGFSMMLSATGIGALAAAGALATFGTMERRGLLVGLGVALVSAGLIGLSFTKLLFLASLCCAVIGFGLILFLATCQTVIQLGTGDHNRGRVMGIWAMVLSGAVPLGNMIAGPAADHWGEPLVIRGLGTACAAAALVLLVLFRPAHAR